MTARHSQRDTDAKLIRKPSLLTRLHSDGVDDINLRRSRDLIVGRWLCEELGHTACFPDSTFCRQLEKSAVDELPGEILGATATVPKSPSWVLAQSDSIGSATLYASNTLAIEGGGSCSSFDSLSSQSYESSIIPYIGYTGGSAVKGLGNFIISGLTYLDAKCRARQPINDDGSCPSLGSLSLHSSESSIAPYIGYTSGSAVKGIGNGIISGFAYVDTKYRARRLSGLARLCKYIENGEKSLRGRAFHRLVQPLVGPAKQMNGLLDDLLEFSEMPMDYESLRGILGVVKKSGRWSAYLHLKVLTMYDICVGHDHGLDPTWTAVVDSKSLFMRDFDSENDALASVTIHLRKTLSLNARLGHASSSQAIFLTHFKILLMTSVCTERAITRTQELRSLLGLDSPRASDHYSKAKQLDNVLKAWEALYCINIHGTWSSNDDSSIAQILCTDICLDLRYWLQQYGSLENWIADVDHPDWAVWLTMVFMRDCGDAFRPALQETRIIMPLLSAVPDNVWIRTADLYYTCSARRQIGKAAGRRCKRRAFALAKAMHAGGQQL